MWNLGKFGQNIALLDERGVHVTYEKLRIESERVAASVGRRCLVFSLCRNVPGSIVGYVGFMNARIPAVLLNSRMDVLLLQKLLEAYAPAYLWVPKDQTDFFPETTSVYEAFEYVLLRPDRRKEYPIHDELGLLLSTSGSTGSQKFVRQSYENIHDNAQSIVQYLKLGNTERPITTLPMHYTYGLSIINSHLLVGATVLVTENTLMQRDFWQFFRKAGATSFGGVPYTYEMLDRLRFYRMDLPSLRTMTQAGGKILPELHEKFAKYAQETGRNFIVMYGQCEATARMAYLPPEKALEKKGSMGIAIPGGRFCLIDAGGREIHSPRTTGELVYRGKNVTLGYAEQASDLIKGDERRGVLETGDMAQFDEDGYYYIVGRKKRFLKIFGNRVSLDEIEQLIKGAFGIEVATAGVDDHMYVFMTDETMTGAVRNFMSEKTGLNNIAFQIVVIDAIPKNDVGKILYAQLAKYYSE